MVDLINYPLHNRKDKQNKKFERVQGLQQIQNSIQFTSMKRRPIVSKESKEPQDISPV